jgi:hypothetical protein
VDPVGPGLDGEPGVVVDDEEDPVLGAPVPGRPGGGQEVPGGDRPLLAELEDVDRAEGGPGELGDVADQVEAGPV